MIKLSDEYQMPYENLFAESSNEIAKGSSTLVEKISLVTWAVFSSLGESTVATVNQLGISFYRRVLGFDGDKVHLSNSLYGVAFKIIFWALGTGAFFAVTACRKFQDKVFPEVNSSSAVQDTYAQKGINMKHLTTQKTSIDMSGVPAAVTLDDLMTMYTEINFLDRAKPGYMPDTSRKEGGKTYSQEALRKSLEKFILYVKTRQAFLGTPPAYDTDKLEAFYKQIEDAVRFSINKVNGDLTAFRNANGVDLTQYTPELVNKYKGLLEDRSRIAIDLAIAGNACGARFMGDSMEAYFFAKGDSVKEEGLQGMLLSILANKRKEIADAQIVKYFTKNGRLDTHDKTAYLQAVGKLAGIPGTENIIEHLSNVSSERYLTLFFKEYTEDCIISALETEIKKEKNLYLRTSLADAITDHLSEIPNEKYEMEALAKFREVEGLLKEGSFSTSQLQTQVANFQELKNLCPAFVFDTGKWDESVAAFFTESTVKGWFLEKMPDIDRNGKKAEDRTKEEKKEDAEVFKKRRTAMQDLVTSCKQHPVLFQGLGFLSAEKMQEEIVAIEKVERVQKLFPGSDRESMARLINSSHLQEGIGALLQKERNAIFKGDLLEKMTSQGLSQELMEWVLVSQGILTAQKIGGQV